MTPTAVYDFSFAPGDQGSFPPLGISNPNFSTDANHAATQVEYQCYLLYVSSTVAGGGLSAGRLLSLPLVQGSIKKVYNAASVYVYVGGATGKNVCVPPLQAVEVYCPDGANFYVLGGQPEYLLPVAANTTLPVHGNLVLEADTNSGVATYTTTATALGSKVSVTDTAGTFGTNKASVTDGSGNAYDFQDPDQPTVFLATYPMTNTGRTYSWRLMTCPRTAVTAYFSS